MTAFVPRRIRRSACPLVLFLTLSAAPAVRAQLQVPLIGDLFKSARTLNLNWEPFQRLSHPTGIASERTNGFFFEVSFDLGDFGGRARRTPADAAKGRRAADSLALAGIDSTLEIRHDTVRVSRTTRRTAKSNADTSTGPLSLEVAVGYGQLTGFRSVDTTAYRLYGSLEEFPVVSLYVAWNDFFRWEKGWPKRAWLYAGARVGWVRLSGFQALVRVDASDSAAVYNGSATAPLLAFLVGVQFQVLKGVDAFVEGGYTWRRFDGVQWLAPNYRFAPDRLPRSIRANTLGISVGGQVALH